MTTLSNRLSDHPGIWVRGRAFAGRLAPGLALTLGMGLAGLWLVDRPWLAHWHLSALTLAIVLGMVVGNAFGKALPASLAPGVVFSQQKLLRLGVILYGLRVTFQDIAAVGAAGLMIDVVIVCGTLVLGTVVGRRVFRLERDTALLTAGGSAICGAAAVLAMERVVKPDPSKVAIAVATVVLFGTLDIFVYPLLFPYLGMTAHQFGVFSGATVHEVAQVVAVGSAVGADAETTAVIVKLTRVMLLVPVLLYLSWSNLRGAGGARGGGRPDVPWFAVLFVVVAAFNSFVTLPSGLQHVLLTIDTLALAAAMAALGLETRWVKLRALGIKPLLLAAVLWVWLMGAGTLLVRIAV
ncbi:YeiH family protein [Dokdonella sp.]|uniref:YeiH family protein n=1 Tax=Dokdonella sp. TaxID=2291710 RepID=UPI0031C6B094|nr:YeiH family protein [Dokdonella sp.]